MTDSMIDPNTGLPVQKNPDVIDDSFVEEENAFRELDAAKIAQEAAKKAAEEAGTAVVDKIVGALRPEKKIDDNAPAWEKENRTPKNYTEIVSEAERRAEAIFERKEKERQEAAKQQQEQSAKEREEYEKSMNDYWDKQIDALVQEGKIPKMADEIQQKLKEGKPLTEEDAQDPGVQARINLFTTASKAKETNLRLVYFEHIQGKDAQPNRQPAGARAPVIGARKGVSRQEEGKFSYAEVHGARDYRSLLGAK